MLASVCSATLFGAEGRPVVVEVHVSSGLPGFTIVGLPDEACREARDRVRAAFLSSELPWPQRRVTVNLAPSGVRKGGAGLDLPIAVGLLVAIGELRAEAVAACGFIGELGLDGSLRPIAGVLAVVEALRVPAVVVPAACGAEAELVGSRRVFAPRSLREAADALSGRGSWPAIRAPRAVADDRPDQCDLADVRGHPVAKRALEVAAAGGHHLLLVGPPGAGKTLLARCLPSLLPDLSRDQALETSRVHSAAGIPLPDGRLIVRPPFRAPHHSTSPVALVGGGSLTLRPGEISLASNGVLFLDELGEFPPGALELLRQPIEEGVVRVARARGQVTYPARTLLVGAMNPCPCGERTRRGGCRCSPAQLDRYARRLSGPLLDRFDLQVLVERPRAEELLTRAKAERSAAVAARVAAARLLARTRGVATNAELSSATLDATAPLSTEARAVLVRRLRGGSLSARGLDRVRRVARTVADLDGRDGELSAGDVSAALELRAGRAALLSEAA